MSNVSSLKDITASVKSEFAIGDVVRLASSPLTYAMVCLKVAKSGVTCIWQDDEANVITFEFDPRVLRIVREKDSASEGE